MSLVELIGDRPSEDVLSEVELEDNDLQLRGQIDLLLLGDEIVVVDLKTQTLLGEEVPAWVQFQLMVYSHLVEETYGVLPARAEVFSLNRGRKEVPITKESLDAALGALDGARTADPSHANPNPETCLFCERRLVCEPHWDVVMSWPETDSVAGTVRRAEDAATGVVALLLETPRGNEWVARIPAEIADVVVGDVVRLVRLRQAGTSSDGVREWRWQRLSSLRKSAASSDPG